MRRMGFHRHVDEAVVEEETEDDGAGARVVHDGLRHDLPHDAVHGGAAGGVEPRRELRVRAADEQDDDRRRQEQRPRPHQRGEDDGHARSPPGSHLTHTIQEKKMVRS
uniref:Uncharacterized protein n=1 Tax=Arundo donax TaxID=35708 RepID=A0A0A9H493_ARUDO